MKKRDFLFIIALFTTSFFFAQKTIVKDLNGKDIDFNTIISESDKDQPILIVTWADSYCKVCESIIDELQKNYQPLKDKYNLKVITLNTDSNINDKFKNHYNKYYKSEMGPYQSIHHFVKNYKNIKSWPFEKYVDEDSNFMKTANLKGAPVFYIFYNTKIKYYRYGFYSPDNASVNDGAKKLKLTTSQLTVSNLTKILESMYADVSYFNSNWLYTLKDEKPSYKRSVLKEGSLFEITDSWITGEKQMRGLFKDKMGEIHSDECTWYYKNGNKKSIKSFKDNKLNGAYIDYNENGNVNWKGSYLNGRYDGKWTGYYVNGKLKTIKNWANGTLESIETFKDSNGNTLLTNGTGLYIEYNKKNLKLYEVSYVNNKLNGKYTNFHENGTIKITGKYWDGKRDDTWTYYDKDGKKEKTEVWVKGKKTENKLQTEPKTAPLIKQKKSIEQEGESGGSSSSKKETFTIVETPPSFIGGKRALSNYLSKNIKYPSSAKRLNIDGKVYISFVVSKTGTITNAKIQKGVQRDLNNEALRVVKNMPKWKPGTQRGKNVNVNMTLPINFSLN